MSKHLERDMSRLNKHIMALGGLVEAATSNAINAIETYDLGLVDDIVRGEIDIDRMEVEIEEECLKTLALHQPVAIDLRFLVVILKVNNDLERMGDQVLNIAERIEFLVGQKRVGVDLNFSEMGNICIVMLRQSLDALVRRDVQTARQVLRMDDELNALHARTYQTLQQEMTNNPEIVVPAVSCLTISSNLERIGDLATNIAEDIIFMEEGEVVRHLSN